MKITLAGIDLAKHCYQVHGVDEVGKAVFRKRLSRKQFHGWLQLLPPCVVAMESCSGSQYWGRVAKEMGHEVKIVPSQFVKPFLKSQKNDFNDAEAIAEAASRPSMRFASIKAPWQQEIQTLHRVRQRHVHNMTALTNQIRSILEEQGIIMAKGNTALNKKLSETLSDPELKLGEVLCSMLQELFSEFLALRKRIEQYDDKLERISKTNDACKRLQTIPGVGVKISTAFIATLGDPGAFKNGRCAAAWLGVVPKQYSSGGKEVLRGITKRGDKHLRSLIIHGSRSVIKAVMSKREPPTEPLRLWVYKKLQSNKHPNKVTVALANKNIRIMWSILRSGGQFESKKAA